MFVQIVSISQRVPYVDHLRRIRSIDNSTVNIPTVHIPLRGSLKKWFLVKEKNKARLLPPYPAHSWWWALGLLGHQGRWWLMERVRSTDVPRSTTRSWQWSCGSTCAPALRCSSQKSGTGWEDICLLGPASGKKGLALDCSVQKVKIQVLK